MGAAKSGTSALCDYLGQHPQIYVPRQKELHYFNTDLIVAGRRAYDLPRYLAYFNGKTSFLCGEGSVWYLYSAEAPYHIHRHNPNAKILISLRNPAEALWSLYTHRQFRGNPHARRLDLRQLLNRERKILKRCQLLKKRVSVADLYLDIVRYSPQVRRYLELFGYRQVKIVLYEQFCANPLAVYKDILQFLEVNEINLPRQRQINQTGRVKSYKVDRLLERSVSVIRPFKPVLPRFLRAQLYRSLHKLNISYTGVPVMDNSTRHEILKELDSDIEELEQLIGRDLSLWRNR